jgi:hypothetical protein
VKITLQIVIIVLAGIFLIAQWSKNTERITAELDQLYSESSTRFDYLQEPYQNPRTTDVYTLPIAGVVPSHPVEHTINLSSIKQKCARVDCILAISEPQFFSVASATGVIKNDTLGIALDYKNEQRFYPFSMLETHELVNDVVAGDPLLISYSPFSGTGIVFDRMIDGEEVTFGVSGMLWQSNLLIYNRAESITEQNLWSQILGAAIVGERSGQTLAVINSDVMHFSDWAVANSTGQVLVTGEPQDIYGGDYIKVAARFEPNFLFTESEIPPDTYVYGVIVNDVPIAFKADDVLYGTSTYAVGDAEVITTKSAQSVVNFLHSTSGILNSVEGFWFAWKAAHPDTLLWSQ